MCDWRLELRGFKPCGHCACPSVSSYSSVNDIHDQSWSLLIFLVCQKECGWVKKKKSRRKKKRERENMISNMKGKLKIRMLGATQGRTALTRQEFVWVKIWSYPASVLMGSYYTRCSILQFHASRLKTIFKWGKALASHHMHSQCSLSTLGLADQPVVEALSLLVCLTGGECLSFFVHDMWIYSDFEELTLQWGCVRSELKLFPGLKAG